MQEGTSVCYQRNAGEGKGEVKINRKIMRVVFKNASDGETVRGKWQMRGSGVGDANKGLSVERRAVKCSKAKQ